MSEYKIVTFGVQMSRSREVDVAIFTAFNGDLLLPQTTERAVLMGNLFFAGDRKLL